MSVSEKTPHFGEPRIALLNKETGEFEELGVIESGEFEELGVIESGELRCDGKEWAKLDPFRGVFEFEIRFTRKMRIKMLQEFGVIKRPRLTYRTIKRNCAKRNR